MKNLHSSIVLFFSRVLFAAILKCMFFLKQVKKSFSFFDDKETIIKQITIWGP
jgi:hypothetical protein